MDKYNYRLYLDYKSNWKYYIVSGNTLLDEMFSSDNINFALRAGHQNAIFNFPQMSTTNRYIQINNKFYK